ncbi:hypothetical protein AAMO2058_000045800 [Amorphochlora amoebiformis]
MASISLRAPGLYRSVLRTIRKIPNPTEREAFLKEAMEGFRANKVLEDEAEILKSVALLSSKISFLHIKYPQTKEPMSIHVPEGLELAAGRGDGVKRTYYFNGERVEEGVKQDRTAKNYRNWLDPDDIKRHHQLIERQHFGGPFWKNKPKF